MADNVVERYTLTKNGTTMTCEILTDGTIKTTTGAVGPQEHQSAEGFMGWLARLTGGKVTINRRGDAAVAKSSTTTRVNN